MEFMMQQQAARGAADNDQTRAMVRDELVNREIVAQEAQRAGMAKTPEVLTQLDLARQEILVSAYIRDWVRKQDRKSTRLNSSHGYISYAVFCLKKKKK